jgi:ABC-type oligopeptide transport system substrate-binding subunit
MRINSNQKKVIIAAMALIAAVALFPPWTFTFKYQSTYSEEPTGYSFVGNPPSVDVSATANVTSFTGTSHGRRGFIPHA